MRAIFSCPRPSRHSFSCRREPPASGHFAGQTAAILANLDEPLLPVIKAAGSGNSTKSERRVLFVGRLAPFTRMRLGLDPVARRPYHLKCRSKVLPLAYEHLLLISKREELQHSSCAKVRGPASGAECNTVSGTGV